MGEYISNIKVFKDKKIRTQWNAEKEDWYFPVVDIVCVLIDKDYDSDRKYWKVLKGRLTQEKINQASHSGLFFLMDRMGTKCKRIDKYEINGVTYIKWRV